MSAPQTNLAKQKRRHRGPLIGIVVVLLFGGAMALFWSGAGSDSTTPVTAPAGQVAPGTAAP